MSSASFSGGIQLWGSTGSAVNIHGLGNALWDLKDIKRQRQLQLMLDFMFGASEMQRGTTEEPPAVRNSSYECRHGL